MTKAENTAPVQPQTALSPEMPAELEFPTNGAQNEPAAKPVQETAAQPEPKRRGRKPKQDQAQAQEQAERMLAEFSLSPVAGKRAKKLSGGYQRRLSIAMALITSPKILFLDEPTLGLDVLARRELWKAVQARKGKITIVLTTHYLEEAEALADRVGILASGKLAALGTVPELLAKTGTHSLEDAFLALSGGEPA